MNVYIPGPEQMEILGAQLAENCDPGALINLQGELGAGKTTIVRGFLRARGYQGQVKSPTYTLVEPYVVNAIKINHFDLYRITQPEELEMIGIRDYLDGESVCLVEWPENGGALIPGPDVQIIIDYRDSGREVHLHANTDNGQLILKNMIS